VLYIGPSSQTPAENAQNEIGCQLPINAVTGQVNFLGQDHVVFIQSSRKGNLFGRISRIETLDLFFAGHPIERKRSQRKATDVARNFQGLRLICTTAVCLSSEITFAISEGKVSA
jgi:hypothetical protein